MWPTYDPGAQWGAALGNGISGGLKALAEHKLQQMQYDKTAKGIRALIPRVSQEDALAIAKGDPKMMMALLEQYSPSGLGAVDKAFNKPAQTGLSSLAQGNNQTSNETQPSKPIFAEGEADFEKPGMRNGLPALSPIEGEPGYQPRNPSVVPQSTQGMNPIFGATKVQQPPSLGRMLTPQEFYEKNPEIQRMAPKRRDTAYKQYEDEWHKRRSEEIEEQKFQFQKERAQSKDTLESSKLDYQKKQDFLNRKQTTSHQTTQDELDKRRVDLQQANQFSDITKGYAQQLIDLPVRIQQYDKYINLLEKSPEKIRTDNGRKMAADVGLLGYGESPEESIVQNSLASIQVSRVQAWRGLGPLSDREGETQRLAEPSLWVKPKGGIAVAKEKKYIDMANYEIAKEYQNILKKNKGVPPLDIQFQALRNTAQKRAELFEKSKAPFRPFGVRFEGDGMIINLDVKSARSFDKPPTTGESGQTLISPDGKTAFKWENNAWTPISNVIINNRRG
jgi:hypothetical protein